MDLNSIPDSTDWKDTRIPALTALESALRCQICKDFYDSPVITSCCHTFCSLCIRRCLTADQICPICRSRDEEIKLRKNNAVEELLDAFVKIREELLGILKEPKSDPMIRQNGEKLDVLERRDLHSEDSRTNGDTRGLRRTTRSTARRSASRLQTPIAQEVIYSNNERGDGDYDPIYDFEDGVPNNEETKEDDGLHECPVCGKRVKPSIMNSHLDLCVFSDEAEFTPAPTIKSKTTHSKPTNSSIHSTPSKRTHNQSLQPLPPPQPSLPITQPYTLTEQRDLRLPKLNYSLLNESKLRLKLSELGVKSTGTKTTLEKRHTEWVNIWNANLDAKAPKAKKQLLSELEQLEKEQMKVKVNPIKKEGFSDEKWVGKHRDDFEGLIRDAKAKRRRIEEVVSDEKVEDRHKKEVLEVERKVGDEDGDGKLDDEVGRIESPFFANGIGGGDTMMGDDETTVINGI